MFIFKKKIVVKILLFVFILDFLVFPKKAHAYLDPGTGSMLIQVLIGGILGSLYFIKLYWKKISSFVKKKFNKNKDGNE